METSLSIAIDSKAYSPKDFNLLLEKPFMNTFGFWFYNELVDLIGIGKEPINLTVPSGETFTVKVDSLRMECFKNEPTCLFCEKRVGTLWVLESHTNQTPYLNLYAVGKKGGLILMNKDSIIPKSRGGEDKLYNVVTICDPCNSRKDNKIVNDYSIVAPRTVIVPKSIKNISNDIGA